MFVKSQLLVITAFTCIQCSLALEAFVHHSHENATNMTGYEHPSDHEKINCIATFNNGITVEVTHVRYQPETFDAQYYVINSSNYIDNDEFTYFSCYTGVTA